MFLICGTATSSWAPMIPFVKARLGLDDQLFARGQLGTSGGAERFRALQESLNMADLQRQMAAIGMGQNNANTRFGNAMGAVGQGMGAQNQAFNMGMGAFGGLQGLFGNLMQQGQLGVGAGSGTPAGIAQWAAQQQQTPWQAGYNFLNQGGVFDRLNGLGGATSQVPMVSQPNLGPINVGTPPFFPMPSGNFGL